MTTASPGGGMAGHNMGGMMDGGMGDMGMDMSNCTMKMVMMPVRYFPCLHPFLCSFLAS